MFSELWSGPYPDVNRKGGVAGPKPDRVNEAPKKGYKCSANVGNLKRITVKTDIFPAIWGLKVVKIAFSKTFSITLGADSYKYLPKFWRHLSCQGGSSCPPPFAAQMPSNIG